MTKNTCAEHGFYPETGRRDYGKLSLLPVGSFSVFTPALSMPPRGAAAMLCRASMTRCSVQ